MKRSFVLLGSLGTVLVPLALHAATATGPKPCHLGSHPPLILLYSGTGHDHDLDFLKGCPGEVVIGEKRQDGPRGALKSAAAHAAGGRTAYVIASNGREIRDLLLNKGAVGAAHWMRKKLDSGYDYIVVDEVTRDPNWRDGTTVNHRFRRMLELLPPRKVIAYISIDLTQQAGADIYLHNRRYLLRALRNRGRALALEVYLHTAQAESSTGAFRTAAWRIAHAVRGMKHASAINRRAISVLGMSIHSSPFPQYHYLDKPSQDLDSVRKQAHAIRFSSSSRLRQQRGIGYYFVGTSDLQPRHGAPYTFDRLVHRMTQEARLWR
jgi:hypothetical protein